MIDLTKNRDLDNIALNFYESIEETIRKNLYEHKDLLNKYETKTECCLGNYLDYNLYDIILTKPSLDSFGGNFIKEFRDLFEKYYSTKKTATKEQKEFTKAINDILPYEKHNTWGAYKLTRLLDINCCPYCNRTYIRTLGTDYKKFTRPDIYHFLSKSEHPYFRLSFYNLIPSCIICNRNAKGNKPINIKNNIHPYLEGFEDDTKFSIQAKTYYDLIGQGNPEISFLFSTNDEKVARIKNNIELFRLDIQYSIHNKEINHLLQTKEAFSKTYIEDLIKRYPDLNLTKEQAIYYLFGINYDNQQDEHMPLSKFKRDIINLLDYKLT